MGYAYVTSEDAKGGILKTKGMLHKVGLPVVFSVHNTTLLVVIVVISGGLLYQLLGVFGGHPNVYSSFHARQRSAKDIANQIIRLEASYTVSKAWKPGETQAAVQEVAHLGNCGKSIQGRKYRSMICTIVRNDIHLREFLVRSLLQGFCHIAVYDNNQIGSGMDHSISLLLDPFVKAGVVSHVPFMQNNTHFLHNDQKDKHAHDCVNRFGSHADWVIIMDTDEYFHISERGAAAAASFSSSAHSSSASSITVNSGGKPPTTSNSSKASVGTLHHFLTAVELSGLNACAVEFPWRMMYGNHLVINHGGLLLGSYLNVCFTSQIKKTLFRTGRASPIDVHSVRCKDKHERKVSVDSPKFQQALPHFKANLLHYYSRSVEEYLVKSEQSMPPYVRLMVDLYDGQRHCGSNKHVDFDEQYTAVVHDIMQRLQKAQGGLGPGGIQLARSPEWQPMGRSDYALYIFLKLRVQQRHEWDEAAYLVHNPKAADLIRAGKYIDGLQHFMMVGFSKGLTSCWVGQGNGEKICVA